MTKYELVKDKLFQKLNYYSEKARECEDLIEFFTMLGWFIQESSEVISKSGLDYSDKKKLLFWICDETNVLYMLYKLNTKN